MYKYTRKCFNQEEHLLHKKADIILNHIGFIITNYLILLKFKLPRD